MKLQISRENSQSRLLPLSHVGTLSSLLWCFLPFHRLLPPITSNRVTAEVKAECSNSVLASKSRVPNPSCSVPIAPRYTHCHLASVFYSPEKADKVLFGLDSASVKGSDSLSGHLLKSCKSDLASLLSVLLLWPPPLCFDVTKHYPRPQ